MRFSAARGEAGIEENDRASMATALAFNDPKQLFRLVRERQARSRPRVKNPGSAEAIINLFRSRGIQVNDETRS